MCPSAAAAVCVEIATSLTLKLHPKYARDAPNRRGDRFEDFISFSFMSSYLHLRQQLTTAAAATGSLEGAVVVALTDAFAIASINGAHECDAATKIQSVARMAAQRKRFVKLRAEVVNIQRCFRGYRGRKHFLRARIACVEAFNRSVFDHFASLIQSCFRGYWLRKTRCDFYARKRYIRSIQDRSEAVRQEAITQAEILRSLHETKQHTEQLAEFKKATANLHHLLSTASVCGIYRAPLSVDGCKTVFGTHMEDELRAVTVVRRKFKKDLPLSSPLTTVTGAESSTTTAGVAPRVPKAPANPIPKDGGVLLLAPAPPSLQNSVAFEKGKEVVQLERSVDKKLQDAIHKGSRFAVRRSDIPKFETTIAAESDFVERSAVRIGKKSIM